MVARSRAGGGGDPSYYWSSISGTVTVQVLDDDGQPQKEVSVLNNARLFAEFGLSKETHALVWTGSTLKFLPRTTESEVQLFGRTDQHAIEAQATTSARVAGPLSGYPLSGLFKDFEGSSRGNCRG